MSKGIGIDDLVDYVYIVIIGKSFKNIRYMFLFKSTGPYMLGPPEETS
jgi:hypothetical protein